MGRLKGKEWEHVTESLEKDRVQCKYCLHTFATTSGTRVRAHFLGEGLLAPCEKVHADIKAMMIRLSQSAKKLAASKSNPRVHVADDDTDDDAAHIAKLRKRLVQPTIISSAQEALLRDAQESLARFFYAEGIAFNKAESVHLEEALQKYIFVGKAGLVPNSVRALPSRYKLSGPMLDTEYKRAESSRKSIQDRPAITYGYSVSSDAYKDTCSRDIVNLVMTTAAGHSFMSAVDTTGESKTGPFIAGFLENEMKKLPGGIESCVVVCTDSASNCKSAGALLEARYPWITWIPCTSHVCDLFLEDISKMSWIQAEIQDARTIITLIRSHNKSLGLFRKYSKTLELLAPGETRFATNFIACERLVEVSGRLKQVVADPEWETWVNSPAAHKYRATAEAVSDCIGSNIFGSASSS